MSIKQREALTEIRELLSKWSDVPVMDSEIIGKTLELKASVIKARKLRLAKVQQVLNKNLRPEDQYKQIKLALQDGHFPVKDADVIAAIKELKASVKVPTKKPMPLKPMPVKKPIQVPKRPVTMEKPDKWARMVLALKGKKKPDNDSPIQFK
jgi:hypothetical protein